MNLPGRARSLLSPVQPLGAALNGAPLIEQAAVSPLDFF